MIDLVCIVADKNIEATLSSLLSRSQALGIRPITWEIHVHPGKDPGCFHHASELLRGFRTTANHALVILDHDWESNPEETAEELERQLEDKFQLEEMAGWSVPVVIDPELEIWIFSDSPHVALALGWVNQSLGLREALEGQDLWDRNSLKPADPKAALEWALREVRRPRSSSIYRDLASRVSTKRCQDRSFLRLRSQLQDWFPLDPPRQLE